MKTPATLAASLISGSLALVSCTPNQQNYGLGGALAGGAAGAIVGGDTSDVVRGAAIGGAGGAAYGAYRDNQQQKVQPTPPAPTPPAPRAPSAGKTYPKAFPSGKPDIVISPYKPYNQIRVKGLKPGELGQDPRTGEIFVVPNP